MAEAEVPSLSIEGGGAAAPAAEGEKAAVDKEIEEIRADARAQIEKYRQETRDISSEINKKRQEHMQRMLDLQKQKEQLEGEIQAKRRELSMLKEQNQRAEQSGGAARGKLTARGGNTTARGGQMTERRRSVQAMLAQGKTDDGAPAAADSGDSAKTFNV
jgi:chromosome segregation ATPase|uniref:Uncharacterized protein n=1 Tax=Haptolina ericina TaxID=156174 RepID=A0A7S3ERW2_9EUKA